MFAREMNGVMWRLLSVFAVISLGPSSFGFLSSINAGKNVIRRRMGVATNIIMTDVRFGIICNLLSSIAYFLI